MTPTAKSRACSAPLPGTLYLLRPDLHIAGRWKTIVADEILQTARICLGIANAMSKMPFDDLEAAYEALATAIDTAGAEREALFLTRLALVLGHELGDIAPFRKAIRTALEGLGIAARSHPDCEWHS